MYWLSLEINAGFVGHLTLHPFVRHIVGLSILDKMRSCLNKAKGHAIIKTFLTERLYPIKITGARSVIVFTTTFYALNLSRF